MNVFVNMAGVVCCGVFETVCYETVNACVCEVACVNICKDVVFRDG